MSTKLSKRNECLRELQERLTELVDDIGAARAATAAGVSSDTIRRRIRGDLPWAFEEVMDLARLEISLGHRGAVAEAVRQWLCTDPPQPTSTPVAHQSS